MSNTKVKNDFAIKVDHVSKWFMIDKDSHNTLKGKFQNLFRRRQIHKERFTALDGIDFEIKEGDFFGIIGKNGSGKSTLLKLIAGIYAPNIGKISTKGKIIPFLELGVGSNSDLTGRENVFLNGTILGLTMAEIEEKYDRIWQFAEISEFQDMQLKHYSSGMMVRLAFSIAMEAQGDIYIMDEVLAVGDANFQRKCIEKLEEKIKAKETIVFVSHDINSIQKYCTRVLYIKDHKIEAIGDPIEVATKYQQDLA